MAGYSGFSMSNNAVDAYDNGEKPLSKWSKAEILQEIRIYAKENNINIDMEKLNKVSLPVLRESFLYKTAYHHTSKFYNSTDFYAIDFDTVNEMVDLESVQKLLELTEEESTSKGYRTDSNWRGSRKLVLPSRGWKEIYQGERISFYPADKRGTGSAGAANKRTDKTAG